MDGLAADNLFLDKPRATYQAEVALLNSKFKNCKAGELKPENWLRGGFELTCDEGQVGVTFTLAPTNPPKIQSLRFTADPPKPTDPKCEP